METQRTIPIMIGVTGHRAIREEDREAIYRSVRTELENLQTAYPNSPLIMLTSLAEGGDLLCAEAACELGISLRVALPMAREEYEKDFSPSAKERLYFHCERAEEVFVTLPTERVPQEGANRDFCFRQAGIYVASHCHILLALWDGGPGTAAACGTAEAVDFALHGSYAPGSGIPVRSESNTGVLHVYTPRKDRCSEAAGAVHFLGDKKAVQDILSKTDEFNRKAAENQSAMKSRFPGGELNDEKLMRMDRVSFTAGRVSESYAKRYRKVLGLMAAASMVLTFAFLMYDEAQAIWMILVCGVMLLGALLCQRYASRSDCHRRYIEYRALAECLRVQLYLRYAGSKIEASGLLSWTQQDETSWIMAALCALSAGEEPKSSHSIRECWVEDQQKYHHWAGDNSLDDLKMSENVIQIALVISTALYFVAVIFELLCGELLFAPIYYVEDAEWYRTALKILLGTISAITLFISNYYGRLSLPRILSDHQKMERFYSKMSDQIAKRGQTDEVLTVLAREELVENGNWCSYQRDNKPDMSL